MNKGRSNHIQHTIGAGDETSPARRLPIAKREADRIIGDIEKEGVIDPSSSPWAPLVLLLKKKNVSTRFYVDYRQVNTYNWIHWLIQNYSLPWT